MQDHEKTKVVEKYPGKEEKDTLLWFESGKRIRNADLYRVEQNPNQDVLTPFELEVKKKLASSPSPYDALARHETEEELAREERSISAKLAHLVRQAKLSPQQEACYVLLYVEKLPDRKVRRRLGIKAVRLCQLKQEITDALIAAHRKGLQGPLPRKRRGKRHLSERQRQVLVMRHKKKLSFERIAAKLGISKQRVHEIYREVQKKVL